MKPAASRQQPLSVLMGSGVTKRREGGVAAIIYNLGRELVRLGHSVTYVFQEDLVDAGSISPRFNELVFSLRLGRYIADLRDKFSIVNLHAPTGFPYGLRRRWLRSRGFPPYVMTLHGLEERRVYAMSREAKKGRAWNFSLKNRLWHRFYHQPRFSWSIRTADGAHTYSREVWAILQLKYNLDADRVAYIPNGVEPRFFIPREYHSTGSVRLLYAGTWLDQRGIFYIREVLRKVTPQIPGLTMTFAGCGVPPEEIQRFFGAELASAIVVQPLVAAESMQGLYAEHDIFLFPSIVEGLPSVLLEAMATGMPVITTETCGMTDVVEDEYNGLLIPPADAAAMEVAILRLARSVELRQKLGEASCETMRRYSWERAARRLEALYRRVLAAETDR
ncbi:MAG TPA: glycosyltransferase family 4 protein [Candidatus Sulfotelmatobacter sp.]|nr:glycosyltransferase family 4 protein [Candidatus Sulfotelmatobacter sp.]